MLKAEETVEYFLRDIDQTLGENSDDTTVMDEVVLVCFHKRKLSPTPCIGQYRLFFPAPSFLFYDVCQDKKEC